MYVIFAKNHLAVREYMCAVEASQWTSNLTVTGSRPPLAKRQMRCVLWVSDPNKLKLLLCPLIYLCNKYNALHQTIKKELIISFSEN